MALAFRVAPTTAADEPFLWRLLGAAADEAGVGPLTADDPARSPFGIYLQGWGRPGDAGVIAHAANGQPLGAAWYRLFPAAAPGYGYVADDVPELTIRALLDHLCQMAHTEGYRAICLSVARANPAQRLYARAGFVSAPVSAPGDASVTLWRQL